MKGSPFIGISLALVLAFAGGTGAEVQAGAIKVAAGDAIVAEAIQQARATLPTFWKTLADPAPEESRFALKVTVRDGDLTEYVWITQVKREDGTIWGRVNNKPKIVQNFELGQKVEIQESDIADWLFMRNGKIVGNETLKALFKHLPPDKAAYFRSLHE